MRLIHCSEAAHTTAILDIFNDAIENSTAIYEYQRREQAFMAPWWAAKEKGNFPVIGFENDEGELMAFASYGTFRGYAAFKYSVEHSIYVHKNFRGRGLARKLMAELIDEARRRGVHVMIGGIDATNIPSISLHKRLGFEPAGVIREAGFKFGRWLDLAFYQVVLQTPANPIDG